MWMFVVVSLGTIHTLRCSFIHSTNQYVSDDSEDLDRSKYDASDKSLEELLGKSSEETIYKTREEVTTLLTPVDHLKITTEQNVNRRYWLVSGNNDADNYDHDPEKDSYDKDANIKSKIATLVDQTLHDTERKIHSLHRIKEKHKNESPYRVGFILSLIKKSKAVLDELFNVAVKHREDYKALEELKIFELIVHTNVDTTNLVRQMVEIHIQHVNSSSSPLQFRSRVVLF